MCNDHSRQWLVFPLLKCLSEKQLVFQFNVGTNSLDAVAVRGPSQWDFNRILIKGEIFFSVG